MSGHISRSKQSSSGVVYDLVASLTAVPRIINVFGFYFIILTYLSLHQPQLQVKDLNYLLAHPWKRIIAILCSLKGQPLQHLRFVTPLFRHI